jgi:hypothetical protein
VGLCIAQGREKDWIQQRRPRSLFHPFPTTARHIRSTSGDTKKSGPDLDGVPRTAFESGLPGFAVMESMIYIPLRDDGWPDLGRTTIR